MCYIRVTYGNLNRKIYIDSNFEHLLASNFTESLFLNSSNVYKILCASGTETRFFVTAESNGMLCIPLQRNTM